MTALQQLLTSHSRHERACATVQQQMYTCSLLQLITSPPRCLHSVAMSVALCLSTCLSIGLLAHLKNHTAELHKIFDHVTYAMTVAQSFFGGVAIRYALPVLRMTFLFSCSGEKTA